MASRFARPGAQRFFDPGGGRAREEARRIAVPRTEIVGPPWGGYTPDLSPDLTTFRDAELIQNLVTVQGIMGPPDGHVRVHDSAATTLPLGTNTPPAASGSEEPVVGLFQLIDQSGTTRQYAVTADGSLGHLYEFSSSSWTNVPAAAAVTLTGNTTGAGVAQTLADFVYHPPSNRLFIVNNFDEVLVHTPGGGTYSEFSPSTLNPFIAQSVEVMDGRVGFLNTSEGGARVQNRFRFTTIGGSAALSGPGSGFIDLDEIEGPGLRLRKLGNVVVAYFKNGVVFLRRTGNFIAPYRREYIDRRRGLAGPFAATDIGRGLHFGIFTDGWFVLSEDGVFQEVGKRVLGGREFRKFTDTFFALLNSDNADRIWVETDIERRLIRIVFPAGDSQHPSESWLYDFDTDSVWPEQFTTVPNCLGRFNDNINQIGWDDIGDTWASVTGAWGDFGGQSGRLRPASGTRDGLVFRYTPTVVTHDGTLPSYRWRSFQRFLTAPSARVAWEKFYASYVRIDGSPTPFSILLHNQNGQVRSAQLTQTKGTVAGSVQTDFIAAHKGGTRLAFELAGVHPAKLVNFQLNYRIEGVEEAKP